MKNSVEWFREAKYGLMIHWGLYSLLGGEYADQYSQEYAEWIQSTLQIPNATYAQLASAFNPIFFDAEKIVELVKAAGMKYLVVTSKHHDGFAMYHSQVDAYNIVTATPFGRDVVRELADACHAADIGFGVYYSQDLDWHEPNGGGYRSNDIPNSGTTWDNSWDFPDQTTKNYSQCFQNKILPQIRELMTNYGQIDLVWFDVPMTISQAESEAIYTTVKSLQPACLINSRLENGQYDYVSLGDNEIPETKIVPETVADYNAINGFKPSPNGLYETAGTLNDSWGFCYRDQNWKAPAMIAQNKQHLNQYGVNFLLNVGLDPLGRVPVAATRNLLKAATLK